jgi:hypothetical protein
MFRSRLLNASYYRQRRSPPPDTDSRFAFNKCGYAFGIITSGTYVVTRFLSDLFLELKDPKTSEERRKELVLFLKEFCQA